MAQEVKTNGSSASGIDTNEEYWKKLETDMRTARRNITLLRRPFTTLRLLGYVISHWVKATFHMIATHPFTLFLAIPLLAIWYIMEHFPGPYTDDIDEVEKWVAFVIWWIGLGILSSVGLGTGMHSGVLFLFPHIMKTCLAAQECETLDFDARGNMWLSEKESTFSCPDDDAAGGHVTFWGIVRKVYPACVLWGVGTAIGEIPPYAVSRAAKLAGQHLDNADELDELEAADADNSIARWDLMKRMKVWMIRFLQRYGFLGVFLMSAWPNMAFDLCGICCGHFLMPFWTFFGATLLGKAGVKVLGQVIFFTMLFSDDHLGGFIAVVSRMSPSNWGLGDILQKALKEGKARFHKSKIAGDNAADDASAATAPDSVSKQIVALWKYVMLGFILLFMISCVDQFAQSRAAEEDEEKLQRMKKEAGVLQATRAAKKAN